MDAVRFMQNYAFEVGDRPPEEWVHLWKRRCPHSWVIAALVEALFLGRYKARSVDQLLSIWKSRGCPRLKCGLDFCRKVWPDAVTAVQATLVRDTIPTVGIRHYAFEAFDGSWGGEEENTIIEIYPLRQQLRQQALPSKLQDMIP